jgi:hypothetical protein
MEREGVTESERKRGGGREGERELRGGEGEEGGRRREREE